MTEPQAPEGAESVAPGDVLFEIRVVADGFVTKAQKEETE